MTEFKLLLNSYWYDEIILDPMYSTNKYINQACKIEIILNQYCINQFNIEHPTLCVSRVASLHIINFNTIVIQFLAIISDYV